MAPDDSLFATSDFHLAQIVTQLTHCNPFVAQRGQLERAALGDNFDERDCDWNLDPSSFRPSANLDRLFERVELAIERSIKRAARKSVRVSTSDRAAYESLAYYALFYRFHTDYVALVEARPDARDIFERFVQSYDSCFVKPALVTSGGTATHMFALQYQLYRAFHHVFRNIVGASPDIIALRAAVWESIFTHDVGRYRTRLFDRMSDFTTLITGPSGTGKELVATAIGTSAYIPFDAKIGRFVAEPADLFLSLNLSALSPPLIESELFGHKKGAFTGAISDRIGWLESCLPYGTIFLDEIGELDESIQVKLLRVLQEREFQRLGETAAKRFCGRIVAATNRDAVEMVQTNVLRRDFFFRICSDRIMTPSLANRCMQTPDELGHIVEHLLTKVLGEPDQRLAKSIVDWIQQELGADYGWPGNVREVEQCIRSWLIRRSYHPMTNSKGDTHDELKRLLGQIELSAEDLMTLYCEAAYAKTGSFVATADQLGIDRRTVKSKVDRS